MNVRELFANAESRNAVFGWSCNFTNVSLTAPGSMEFKMKAARFDGINFKNHMLWWDDWSFVETLKAFAQQEYLKLVPIASNQLGADYVATRISNSVCLTPDGESAWAWGEIALLLESLDREQLRSFGTLWLAPNGSRAGFHTNRLVEVLENCYTVSTFALEQTNAPAMNAEVGKSKPIELQVPLTENDRNLLVAMLQANSSKVRPTTGEELMKLAIGSGDKNKAFKRLKESGLVGSKGSKGGGYWLTETGSIIAKDLTINH